MTDIDDVVSADTFEGRQELQPRKVLSPREVLREVGAVLRRMEVDC